VIDFAGEKPLAAPVELFRMRDRNWYTPDGNPDESKSAFFEVMPVIQSWKVPPGFLL